MSVGKSYECSQEKYQFVLNLKPIEFVARKWCIHGVQIQWATANRIVWPLKTIQMGCLCRQGPVYIRTKGLLKIHLVVHFEDGRRNTQIKNKMQSLVLRDFLRDSFFRPFICTKWNFSFRYMDNVSALVLF